MITCTVLTLSAASAKQQLQAQNCPALPLPVSNVHKVFGLHAWGRTAVCFVAGTRKRLLKPSQGKSGKQQGGRHPPTLTSACSGRRASLTAAAVVVHLAALEPLRHAEDQLLQAAWLAAFAGCSIGVQDLRSALSELRWGQVPSRNKARDLPLGQSLRSHAQTVSIGLRSPLLGGKRKRCKPFAA